MLKSQTIFDMSLPDWPGNNPVVIPLFEDVKDKVVFRGNIYCDEIENVSKFSFGELSTVFGVNSKSRNFYNSLEHFQSFFQLKDLNLLLSMTHFELSLLRLPVSIEILRIDLDFSNSEKKMILDTTGSHENFPLVQKLIEEIQKDEDVERFLFEIRNSPALKNFQFFITTNENHNFPFDIFVYAIAQNLRKASDIFLSNECGDPQLILNPTFLVQLLPYPCLLKSLGVIFERQHFSAELLPFCRNIKEINLTLHNSSGPGIKNFFKQLGKMSIELVDIANISLEILKVILNQKYFSELRSFDASIHHQNCETIPFENQSELLFTKRQLKIFRVYLTSLSKTEVGRLENFVKKLKYHPSLHYIKLVSKAVQIVRNGFYQDPYVEFFNN
jgi:hypothetical protein